jgi:hypothetical protein
MIRKQLSKHDHSDTCTHYLNLKTSILMLEGSQLRLLNIISLLSVYLSQSKKKWWEFSHGAPQLQEAFDNIFSLHKS